MRLSQLNWGNIMASRKDYVAFAEIIAAEIAVSRCMEPEQGKVKQETAKSIASAMADMFATDNSRFDRARFLAACGI